MGRKKIESSMDGEPTDETRGRRGVEVYFYGDEFERLEAYCKAKHKGKSSYIRQVTMDRLAIDEADLLEGKEEPPAVSLKRAKELFTRAIDTAIQALEKETEK